MNEWKNNIIIFIYRDLFANKRDCINIINESMHKKRKEEKKDT